MFCVSHLRISPFLGVLPASWLVVPVGSFASIDHLPLLLLSLIVSACPYCAASKSTQPRTEHSQRPHGVLCGGTVWVRGTHRRPGGHQARYGAAQRGAREEARGL